MFGKIETLPRTPSGTLRNEWLDVAVHAYVLAMIRLGTAAAQQQLEAVWVANYAPVDGVRRFLELKKENAINDLVRGFADDAEPDDAAKSKIQLDLDVAREIIKGKVRFVNNEMSPDD